MKKNVKIIVIVFMIVIAINITVIMVAFAGKSHEPVHNPGSSVANMVTPTTGPTAEPTASVIPTEPPDATPTSTTSPSTTTPPTATPSSAQTGTPTPTQTSAPTSTPSGGGGGGGGTQPTPAPTPTQTPTTIVSVNTISQVNNGGTFTIDININNVTYMAYAQFDLKFNSNCISYSTCNPKSQIGDGTGDVLSYINEPGLLRVIVDYSSYAEAHSGNGISGSGYLCKLTFTAVNTGNCLLDFVEGQGEPPGKLKLWKWVAYSASEIANVGWTNGSITVY